MPFPGIVTQPKTALPHSCPVASFAFLPSGQALTPRDQVDPAETRRGGTASLQCTARDERPQAASHTLMETNARTEQLDRLPGGAVACFGWRATSLESNKTSSRSPQTHEPRRHSRTAERAAWRSGARVLETKRRRFEAIGFWHEDSAE